MFLIAAVKSDNLNTILSWVVKFLPRWVTIKSLWTTTREHSMFHRTHVIC